MAIVNQRYRDIARTVLLGETPDATTAVEIHDHYGVCYGKTANAVITKQISTTAAAEALAGQASVIWEFKSLFLSFYTGLTDATAGTVVSIMDGDLVAATGVLTFTGIAVEDTTVTIGNRVYTWKVTPSADDEVTIGANQAASEANLTTAINDGPQGGGAAHTQVTAVDGAGTVTLTAVTAGSAGNAIVTTETMASASFGAATLTGGNDGTELTHFTLNEPDHLAVRFVECLMLFDPVLRTSAGNGIFVKTDTAFGSGGNCCIAGVAWEVAA
jgi:hypothetical protein